jgi:hypothetical protein
LCDNASAGEKGQGHAVGFLSSEGEIVDAEGLRGALVRWVESAKPAASDQYGNGANRLYTIACPAGIAPCRNQFGLVFSQLPSTGPTPSAAS